MLERATISVHRLPGRARTPSWGLARPSLALGLALALAVSLAACSSSGSGNKPGIANAPLAGVPAGNPYTAWSHNGPYAPGITFATTPSGDPVVIYYPVERSAVRHMRTYTVNILRYVLGAGVALPPALAKFPSSVPTDSYENAPLARGGPFPVVLFSHGFGSYPEQSSFLTDHLATWGLVVAAPDQEAWGLRAALTGTLGKGPDDPEYLLGALSLLKQMDHAKGGMFSGRLDLSRVGSLGHSLGGGAAIDVADNPAIRTYVALAPVPGTPPPAGKFGLVMVGTADRVVPASSVEQTYAKLPEPKRLVLIDGAGHNVFDDICTIGHTEGGIATAIHALKALPKEIRAIATDGCEPPDIYPPKAWPLIDQAVTAALRYGLGIGTKLVGIGPGLDHAFFGVTARLMG